MSIHPENKPTATGTTLLTPNEQTICKQIATRETPHKERALALLALQAGSSQAQAAEKSGLSAGQVKYWSAKFRKQQLGIFPEALLAQPKTKAEVKPISPIAAVPEKSKTATDDSMDIVPAKAQKLTKKARKELKAKLIKKNKKGKKEKRSKKDIKTKKSKKSKKSKKAKKK